MDPIIKWISNKVSQLISCDSACVCSLDEPDAKALVLRRLQFCRAVVSVAAFVAFAAVHSARSRLYVCAACDF